VAIGLLGFMPSLAAQNASVGASSAQVPPLIQFSNVATDEGGNTLSDAGEHHCFAVGQQPGSEPLWTETQNNVHLDSVGHSSVQLGVTRRVELPASLFTTWEARWPGVRIAEQTEEPAVLLVSVPYALRAADTATIGVRAGLAIGSASLRAFEHRRSAGLSAGNVGNRQRNRVSELFAQRGNK
jgi:hypothetical protein